MVAWGRYFQHAGESVLDEQREISLRDLALIIRRGLPLMLAVAVGAAVATFYLSSRRTPTFESTAVLLVGRPDVTTGEALSGPVPTYLGNETAPPRTAAFLNNTDMLMQYIHTQPIRAYPAKIESGWVLVAL